MSTRTSVRRAVRYALLSSAVAASATTLPAFGQETIQEVVVTGSRIPQPNLTSISPVQSVGAEAVKIQGVTRVEDLINNLPQAFADLGGNLSNGSPGTATVSLRNLENQRTLVLVNGRRLMPGDPTQNGNAAPDLNQIPSALIERVEVLTGGASAVYGADAVAGVVNFIMNDHFEGIRVDANYNFYQHTNDNAVGDIVRQRGFTVPDKNVVDGYTRDITFIMGGNFADGAGNVTAYLGYRRLNALTQAQRDFSACTFNSGDVFTCGGSSTTAPGRFDPNDGGDYTIDAAGNFIPYDPARDAFNFAPTNYYQRPDERYTAGLFGRYEFSDKAQAYTEFMFMDDRTVAQIAPSGAFIGSGPGATNGVPDGTWLTNCDNPFLSASQRAAICVDTDGNPLPANSVVGLTMGRRNVEGGPRQDDLGHTSYRAVLGLRGDLSPAWSYDVYGMYGTTRLQENYQNDMSSSRLNTALQAVVDPLSGDIVCRANANGANGAPGCVPYNIWQPGGVTPEALAYIQTPGFQEGWTREQIVSGSFTGQLGEYGIKLPTANDGLGIAVGAEYRKEETELKVDEKFYTNDLAGQGSATLPMSGSFDVWELFAEARLPILQDKAFAKSLSVEAGYRYSDYDLGFSTDTYKAGVDWAPVDDIRFRGSYQRAVRAPNLQELFLPQKVQLDGTTDPCAGAITNPGAGLDQQTLESGRTFAECQLSGVTANTWGNIIENSAAQYNGLTFGTATLQPEKSDTISFGLVFTPTFLDGLDVTIDYFDIKVTDVIDTYGADYIINTCVTTGALCEKINRAPETGGAADGTLWIGPSGYIVDGFFNLGELRTKGIDLSANYRLEIGNAGALNFGLQGTYTDTFEKQPDPASSARYDCVGLYGSVCLAPIPQWRHNLRTTWTFQNNLSVTLTWRHIDSVDLDHTSTNPALAGDVPLSDETLGSRDYFDLTGAYTFFENYTLRLGVNNLADKDPPLLGQDNLPSVVGNGNTFPQVYDTMGRYGFINLTMDF